MRSLIAGAALAMMALVTGCQTPRTFATPEASWKSHIGQLKYDSGERTLVGEVIVTRSAPQEFQLEFLKGGSFRLLKLWMSGSDARAEGVLARGSWQGALDRAPDHLQTWVQLPAIFAATDAGQRQWTAAGVSVEIQATGKTIDQIRVRALSSDEEFVFRFQP